MAKQMIPVGENQIACHIWGSGPPVLLIHGFPLDHTMWSAQIEALSSSCQVLAPDLRGYGNSTMQPEGAEVGVDMANYANDLERVLDALPVNEPVILCGFSMGGYILWQFAMQFPERVKALVLCDTRADDDSTEASVGRIKMAESVAETGAEPVAEALLPKLLAPETLTQRPELADRVKQMILAATPAAIAASQRGMARREDVRNSLATFDWPALVLVGSEDVITPPDVMQSVAESLPQAEYCQIANAGHMSPLENADAVNEALLRFCGALS